MKRRADVNDYSAFGGQYGRHVTSRLSIIANKVTRFDTNKVHMSVFLCTTWHILVYMLLNLISMSILTQKCFTLNAYVWQSYKYFISRPIYVNKLNTMKQNVYLSLYIVTSFI